MSKKDSDKSDKYDFVGDSGRNKIKNWENWLEYYWNLYKQNKQLKYLEKFDDYKNKIQGVETVAAQIIKESTKVILGEEILETIDLYCKIHNLDSSQIYLGKVSSSLYSLHTGEIAGKDSKKQKQKQKNKSFVRVEDLEEYIRIQRAE